jgi:putative aldouronate transport system substrate-binding protein
MSKKRYLLVLCFVFVAAWLSAGGQLGGGGSTSTQEGPVKITWVSYQMAPIADHPRLLERIEKQFDVDIEVWNVESANYDEQLNLKFAANEIPDFFRTSVGNLQRYVDQGIVMPIDPARFERNMPVWDKSVTSQYADWKKLFTINGKLWAIPQDVRKPNRGPAIYRGDWLEKLGKKVPTTLAEFRDVVYAFANNDPDGNGKKDTYGLSGSGMNMVYGAYGYIPGQWNEKNGQLVYSSIQPEVKEALGVLAQYYKDGVLSPEFITGENKGGYWAVSHAFTEGQIGFTGHAADYHYNEHQNANVIELQKVNPQATIAWGKPVTGPAGKKGLPAGQKISGGISVFGAQVEDDLRKFDKWCEIQEWIAQNADNYLMAYGGPEGELWHWSDGVDSVMVPLNNDATIWSREGGHTLLANVYDDRIMEHQSAIMYRERKWNGMYEDGLSSELLISLPSSPQYSTELNKIESEVRIAIITGERPLSYFDEFVREWKAAGGDVLTREANAWWATLK